MGKGRRSWNLLVYRDGGKGGDYSNPEFDREAQVALQDGTTGLKDMFKVNHQHKTHQKS